MGFSFLLRLILIDHITFRQSYLHMIHGFSFLLWLILIDHITFRQSYHMIHGFLILIEGYFDWSYNISTILPSPWGFSFLLRHYIDCSYNISTILPPPPWGFSFLLRFILIDHITFRQSYHLLIHGDLSFLLRLILIDHITIRQTFQLISMGFFILIEAYIDWSYNISTILPPPPWGSSLLLRLILIDHITFRQSYYHTHGVFHSYWGLYWLII